MKKSNHVLAAFLLNHFKESPPSNYSVDYSAEFSEAVILEIGQRCCGAVLKYLEREAKLHKTSFSDYFMKKMANNRLLKALGADLAQLAILELATLYAKPDEEDCAKNLSEDLQAACALNPKPNLHEEEPFDA